MKSAAITLILTVFAFFFFLLCAMAEKRGGVGQWLAPKYVTRPRLFVQQAYPLSNFFFKNILSPKSSEGEGELLFKFGGIYNRWLLMTLLHSVHKKVKLGSRVAAFKQNPKFPSGYAFKLAGKKKGGWAPL